VTVVEDTGVEAEDAPGGAVQPRQLIVTVYGLYARGQGGWLSVASVVRLLADLDVDAQAVRSSISRLKRRGLLVAEKRGGAAGYTLSPAGQEILAEGDARIFGRRRATAGDGWLVVVFSVPETVREKRYRLRTELTRLGFGTVTPGVWIAPGHLQGEAAEVLERLELTDNAEVFRGEHVAFGEPVHNIARWWDLPALDQLYTEFLDRYRPVEQRSASGGPAGAFTDYVEMVTRWRRLPYADPGLPLELLPADWKGLQAQDLFARLREKLAGPAGEHVSAILAAGAPRANAARQQ
jgi:phenylacetic acid degradation operon negative regulatory protein